MDNTGKTHKGRIWRRSRNAVMEVIRNPYNILVVVCIVVLGYLIIVPLIEILRNTVIAAESELRRLPGLEAGDFTLYYWNRILASNVSSSLFYKPFLNSILIAVCVSVSTTVLGCLLAWILVRSNIPCKKLLSLAIVIPYMIPSQCNAQAWLTMFKNTRIGGAAGFLQAIGIAVPDWLAYGFVPMIIVFTLHYTAYTYLLVSAALSSVNSELEEMGEIAGAKRLTMLFRITFPLVLPAVLSGVILTFSKALSSYTIPAYLGLPANVYTISTMMTGTLLGSQNIGAGYCMAILLITFSALNILLYQFAVGRRRSYVSIGGKGGRSTLIDLGKAKQPLLVLLILFMALFVVFPIVVLFLDSTMLITGRYSLSNFTLHYWSGKQNLMPKLYEGEAGILVNSSFYLALKNTLMLAGGASVIAAVCGQITGYISARGRNKLSGKFIDQLVFIPYLIPSIAFGALYLAMFSQKKLLIPSLYGTFTLLLLTNVVKNLPFAARSGTSTMLQISSELEEAAELQGAKFIKRFSKIVMPLTKSGFISGLMLILISVIKELDLIIMLVSPKTMTLPYLAYWYTGDDKTPYASAVSVVLFVLVLVIYALIKIFGHADLASGIGGGKINEQN